MTIIYGLILLSVLVFIHELGHFLAAKLCKIPVEVFSIGFGKAIIKKKIGETEYCLAPIPFGGYVKMRGESPDDDSEDGFRDHPISHRALVAVAGPLFNFLSAILFLVFVNMGGSRIYHHLQHTNIGAVDPLSQSYELLRAGDSIIAIDGKSVSSWRELDRAFARLNRSYRIEFIRDGENHEVTIDIPLPDQKTLTTIGSGLYPAIPGKIDSVITNSAAYSGGIISGDSIISINGNPLNSWVDIHFHLRNWDSLSNPLEIGIVRGDLDTTLMVTPMMDPSQTGYILGVIRSEPSYDLINHNFFSAIPVAINQSVEIAEDIFRILNPRKLRILLSYASGPIGIMQISGSAVRSGFQTTLTLMALLSINLGILNLLPLAITDGGILFFLMIEFFRGKPLSLAFQERVSKLFFIMFFTLFIVVTVNDILRFSTLQKLLP